MVCLPPHVRIPSSSRSSVAHSLPQYVSSLLPGVPQSVRDVARVYRQVERARQQQQLNAVCRGQCARGVVVTLLLLSYLQPVLVVSALGAGRAGCFCAVGVAHQMMTTPGDSPPCWEHTENNLLDQVCACEICSTDVARSAISFSLMTVRTSIGQSV